MGNRPQPALIEIFDTRRPSNPLFCHQEFLEKLSAHERDSIGRRAAFLLQRLAVDSRRIHYKATQGANKGWRRSRLGGNHGSHFYAWWAPGNAPPLKQLSSGLPAGSIILRDIRHHDDHSPVSPQSLDENYMPVTVRDLRTGEYAPEPMTPQQLRFASGRQSVRLLKGHPGSGKTTALWNAADATGAAKVLYVTYSEELAGLAREYFDRFCSSGRQFDVVTFPALLRLILADTNPPELTTDGRRQFRHDIVPLSRTLGPWINHYDALYDEFHAHLIGDAVPVAAGRFAACSGPHVPDKAFRERRARSLGVAGVATALEAANRLARGNGALADRYFPELALAWRALRAVEKNGAPAAWDCIAVDECQDLTAMEAMLILELARRINAGRRTPISLLLAGDEAQTVRPTDFEWAWLSDLLHARIGTPYEYKLSANLRSPRRIAEIVNRAWDLYSLIGKHERPSGSGLAEVEDDSSDQVLYCTASPGPELNELLASMSTREGTAIISLADSLPDWLPEAVRGAVLTVPEAKGLDFHSVCVLDAGQHIERIGRDNERMRGGYEVEELRKRLAIDQLRVALSRPTERLFWLDISPSAQVVRSSLMFLNGYASVAPISASIPAAMLKALEEDELDTEERIQRCQHDARQLLSVRPELAWSRATQAVTLLGDPGSLAAVTDESVRAGAFLTLAEVSFGLAFRNTRMAPELGRLDLFREATQAASAAGRKGLGEVIDAIGNVHRATVENRLAALVQLAQILPEHKDEIEGWLRAAISTVLSGWTGELEAALFNGHNAGVLIKILPPFYEAAGVPDSTEKIGRIKSRGIQLLIRDKQFGNALAALREMPERQPKVEAVCHEGMGDFRSAAECHRLAGNLKEALSCYRSVPDLESALALATEIGDQAATESLQWVVRVQKLVAERPDKFTKVMTTAEKKLLQDVLEKALGVTRKPPATRKAAAKKPAAKKAAAKKAPAARKRARYDDDRFF